MSSSVVEILLSNNKKKRFRQIKKESRNEITNEYLHSNRYMISNINQIRIMLNYT